MCKQLESAHERDDFRNHNTQGLLELDDCACVDSLLCLDDELKETMEQNGWQQCPSCYMVVELVDGCRNLVCACGCMFCYKCGQKEDAVCLCAEEYDEEDDENDGDDDDA